MDRIALVLGGFCDEGPGEEGNALLGGLGGAALPPLFAATKEFTGFPQSTFVVLLLLILFCLGWLPRPVFHMPHNSRDPLWQRFGI